MSKYYVTCYGDRVAEYATEEEAKRDAEEHIRNCPEGTMEWATDIQWHSLTIIGGWASAANGEWLNHRIEVD